VIIKFSDVKTWKFSTNNSERETITRKNDGSHKKFIQKSNKIMITLDNDIEKSKTLRTMVSKILRNFTFLLFWENSFSFFAC
jgi:hypothetical protein